MEARKSLRANSSSKFKNMTFADLVKTFLNDQHNYFQQS